MTKTQTKEQPKAPVVNKPVKEAPKTKEQILSTLKDKKQKQGVDSKNIEKESKQMKDKLTKVTDKAMSKMSVKHVEKVLDNKEYQKNLDQKVKSLNISDPKKKEMVQKNYELAKKDPYTASLLNNSSFEGLPKDYKAKLKETHQGKTLPQALEADLAQRLGLNVNNPEDKKALKEIIKNVGAYRGIDVYQVVNVNKKVDELKNKKEVVGKDGKVTYVEYSAEDKKELMFGEKNQDGKRYGWEGMNGDKIVIPNDDGTFSSGVNLYKDVDKALENPDLKTEDVINAKKSIIDPIREDVINQQKIENDPKNKAWYKTLLQVARDGGEINAQDMKNLTERQKVALTNIANAQKISSTTQSQADALMWKTVLEGGVLVVSGPVGYGVMKGAQALHEKVMSYAKPEYEEIGPNLRENMTPYQIAINKANLGMPLTAEEFNSFDDKQKQVIKGLVASNAQVNVDKAIQDTHFQYADTALTGLEVAVPMAAGMVVQSGLKKIGTQGVKNLEKNVVSKEMAVLENNVLKKELSAVEKNLAKKEFSEIEKNVVKQTDDALGGLEVVKGTIDNSKFDYVSLNKVTKEFLKERKAIRIIDRMGKKLVELEKVSFSPDKTLSVVEKEVVKSTENVVKSEVQNVSKGVVKQEMKVGEGFIKQEVKASESAVGEVAKQEIKQNENNVSKIIDKAVQKGEKAGYKLNEAGEWVQEPSVVAEAIKNGNPETMGNVINLTEKQALDVNVVKALEEKGYKLISEFDNSIPRGSIKYKAVFQEVKKTESSLEKVVQKV